jgi:hypothetical protein
MPDIVVINESTVVRDEDLMIWTRAVQRQLDEHVAPFWGVTAKLHNIPKGTPRPTTGDWWMVILDDTDMAGALGYHDLGHQGQPMGKVFARTVLNEGWGALESPSRVLSHETIELLVDPNMVRIIDLPDAEYLVEVGDPVSLPTQGYSIGNVLVSDWATPAYYHYNTDTRYDHEGYLTAPCPAMVHGSYLMYRRPGTLPWQNKQMLVGTEGPELDRLRYLMRPRQGSRRNRRIIGRADWIRSTAAPPPDLADLAQATYRP